jgi:hypothetical protein
VQGPHQRYLETWFAEPRRGERHEQQQQASETP